MEDKNDFKLDPSSFKFQRMWTKHPELLDFVYWSWNQPCNLFRMHKMAKFFHQKAIHERWKASIASLTLPEGTSTSDHNIIRSAVIGIFHNQLTIEPAHEVNPLLKHVPNLVTGKDNDFKLKTPTLEEVNHAVWSIPMDSTPSPNGFSHLLSTFLLGLSYVMIFLSFWSNFSRGSL